MTARAMPTSEMRITSAMKAPNLGLERCAVVSLVDALAVVSVVSAALARAVAVVFASVDALLGVAVVEALADTGCSVPSAAIGAGVSDAASLVSEAIGAVLVLALPLPAYHQRVMRSQA
jgi:hypothetical protein